MSETQTYDYHPPLPTPDTEAPEASLGDCAICMDAILPIPARHGHAHTPSAEEEKGLLSGVSSMHIHSSGGGGSGGGSGAGGAGEGSGGGGAGVLARLWNVVNGRARERASGRGGGRKNYSLAPCGERRREQRTPLGKKNLGPNTSCALRNATWASMNRMRGSIHADPSINHIIWQSVFVRFSKYARNVEEMCEEMDCGLTSRRDV